MSNAIEKRIEVTSDLIHIAKYCAIKEHNTTLISTQAAAGPAPIRHPKSGTAQQSWVSQLAAPLREHPPQSGGQEPVPSCGPAPLVGPWPEYRTATRRVPHCSPQHEPLPSLHGGGKQGARKNCNRTFFEISR